MSYELLTENARGQRRITPISARRAAKLVAGKDTASHLAALRERPFACAQTPAGLVRWNPGESEATP